MGVFAVWHRNLALCKKYFVRSWVSYLLVIAHNKAVHGPFSVEYELLPALFRYIGMAKVLVSLVILSNTERSTDHPQVVQRQAVENCE
jgi:hypothetical protein